MNIEIWRDVQEFKGIYQVSNFGNVRNRDYKILSPQLTNSGYYIVHLYKKNKRTALTIHRLVAAAFIPNPENKTQVDHIDCIKTNNTSTNLRWFTQEENMRHASASGMLDNAAIKARERMKIVGSNHGFVNSQNHLVKAKPVVLKIGSDKKQFRSHRQAASYLGIDRGTLTRRLEDGVYD